MTRVNEIFDKLMAALRTLEATDIELAPEHRRELIKLIVLEQEQWIPGITGGGWLVLESFKKFLSVEVE